MPPFVFARLWGYYEARATHAVTFADDGAHVVVDLVRGSKVVVLGLNGAGKTTLLAILLGFLRPTSGALRIDGLEPRAFVEAHGVAYVPELMALPTHWTVDEALRRLATLADVPAAELRGAVDRVEIGRHHVLGQHGDAEPRLDGGERAGQRAARVGNAPRPPRLVERLGDVGDGLILLGNALWNLRVDQEKGRTTGKNGKHQKNPCQNRDHCKRADHQKPVRAASSAHA